MILRKVEVLNFKNKQWDILSVDSIECNGMLLSVKALSPDECGLKIRIIIKFVNNEVTDAYEVCNAVWHTYFQSDCLEEGSVCYLLGENGIKIPVNLSTFVNHCDGVMIGPHASVSKPLIVIHGFIPPILINDVVQLEVDEEKNKDKIPANRFELMDIE